MNTVDFLKKTFLVPLVCLASATQAATPWINDNPEYVEGRFGEGLKFNFWRSRVFLKTSGLMSPKEGTLQFWMSPCKDYDKLNSWSTIVSAGTSKRQETKAGTFGMTLVPPHVDRNGTARFAGSISSRNPGSVNLNPVDWKKGTWRAIAMTWGPEGMTLYVDGKCVASKKGAVSLDEAPEYLSFGGGTCKRYDLFADSIIDEIELSDCVRPEAYIKAWAEAQKAPVPDGHTTALYHCDESSEGYWKMTPFYRRENPPSASWSSGFFDDYGTFQYGRKPELPFTLVNSAEKPVEFKVSVEVKNHDGGDAGKRSANFNVPSGAIEEKHIIPDISTPGWYSCRILITADGRKVMDETHSFVILPKASAESMNASNYLGNHLEGTRKTDFFTQAGIPWERDMKSFTWAKVQPERGVWDWRAGDFIVKAAKEHGMRLVGILGHPAEWAAAKDVSRWKKTIGFPARAPENLDEFSEYVYKTVSRYKNEVKYWEIWNEPDWNIPPGSCGFSGTDAEYMAVLKIAYEAAKKADPGCTVLSGGFVPHEHLIAYLVENGGTKYFDILGMHRYRPWEHLEKYAGMVKKPAWQTEHLIGTPEDVASDAVNALKSGFEKNFYQDANTSCMTNFNVGKFEAYGWEPQPVYFAMANFANKIGGKENSGKIEFSRMGNMIDAFVFDRDKAAQTIMVYFNYAGPNKLTVSFLPSADGEIIATGLMGKTLVFNAKKGSPLTAEVDNTLFLEGPVAPDSLRVASFEEKELLQNADFKLLEGDIGIDNLRGMRPKDWHIETEKGFIGMKQLADDSYAVEFKSPGGSKPIRVSQGVLFATPGQYTLSAEFMNMEGDPTAYLICNKVWRSWGTLPKGQWKNCCITFRIEAEAKISVVMGFDRGEGTLLLRNPRLARTVDPVLMKNTLFIDLSPQANQSFDDEAESDGKGGWGDMGKSNLSLMQKGVRDFGTALFKIGEGERGCIMLGEPWNMPKSVANISIGTKLEALNFLCTAMNVKAKPGECIGMCMVRYADGSGAEIPFARGKEIDDWFPPMIGKDVKVAETVRLPGGGERASFIASWKNPHPEKEIKNVSFKSEGNALWAIIAISGEKKK